MIFLLFLLSLTSLYGDITVDLREPVLEKGVVSTTKGGVITGPHFRLQAENISYTKRKGEHRVTASCFVMVDFGDYVFVGESLQYDFETETGVIENGVSRQLPWYFGGERIEIRPDGSYLITHAYVTTSENDTPDWEIQADEVIIKRDRTLDLSGIQLRLVKLPFFWLPTFKINLSTLTEAPVRFYARWGGKQGFRVGMRYSLWEYNRFKTYLRFDWRFKRGPGGGFETYYASEDGKHTLETINYYANDNSLENLHEKTRYRFQGIYNNSLYDDKITVYASWDKLSDKDMATDYSDRGLELDTAGRTELLIRKEDEWLITNLTGRMRANYFQTVKQELPSLLFSQRPYVLGKTGLVIENELEASYLDFQYSDDARSDSQDHHACFNIVGKVHDYSSPRLMHKLHIFRPLHPPGLTITPEAGMTTMVYANSNDRNAKYLALGLAGLKGNTTLFRTCGKLKHVFTPYFDWQYISAPTVNPNDHYIFDIDDGLWRLHSFRFGTRQDLVLKQEGGVRRILETDLFTYLFADSAPIQKLFGNLVFRPWPTVRQSIESGWDFSVNQLDHFNFRNDWTVSRDCALSFEWRHRSEYAWRKAVWNNFILDSFRSTHCLLQSSISDRRDTLLCHLFWRLHPLFAVEFESRQGWNRKHERSYAEFEIDLLTRLRSHWNVKLSYAHTEADDRVAIYFSLDLQHTSKDSSCLLLPVQF